jgi:hypothetical protein
MSDRNQVAPTDVNTEKKKKSKKKSKDKNIDDGEKKTKKKTKKKIKDDELNLDDDFNRNKRNEIPNHYDRIPVRLNSIESERGARILQPNNNGYHTQREPYREPDPRIYVPERHRSLDRYPQKQQLQNYTGSYNPNRQPNQAGSVPNRPVYSPTNNQFNLNHQALKQENELRELRELKDLKIKLDEISNQSRGYPNGPYPPVPYQGYPYPPPIVHPYPYHNDHQVIPLIQELISQNDKNMLQIRMLLERQNVNSSITNSNGYQTNDQLLQQQVMINMQLQALLNKSEGNSSKLPFLNPVPNLYNSLLPVVDTSNKNTDAMQMQLQALLQQQELNRYLNEQLEEMRRQPKRSKKYLQDIDDDESIITPSVKREFQDINESISEIRSQQRLIQDLIEQKRSVNGSSSTRKALLPTLSQTNKNTFVNKPWNKNTKNSNANKSILYEPFKR